MLAVIAIVLLLKIIVNLCIHVCNFNSAEVAGDETLYASYLIAATRPVGKPLLILLLSLVCKPFLEMILTSQ